MQIKGKPKSYKQAINMYFKNNQIETDKIAETIISKNKQTYHPMMPLFKQDHHLLTIEDNKKIELIDYVQNRQ